MLDLEQQILQLTKRLVALPSVSGDSKILHKTINCVRDFFVGYDCVTQEYERNGVPSLVVQNFEGIHADIILSGHIDVVPPTTEGQFEPRLVGGKLYGRGAGDMKCSVAIMMHVMRELLQKNYTDKRVCLMITGDEEPGGDYGTKKLVEDIGYRGTVVFVPDAGSLDSIVYSEKGLLRYAITATGQSAHASRNRQGLNAIEQVYDRYTQLKKTIGADVLQENKRGQTATLSNIQGGNGAINMVPDMCNATIDIRFTNERSLQTLQSAISELTAKYPISLQKLSEGEVLRTDPQNVLLQAYLTKAKKRIGENVSLATEHAGCDGRYFSPHGSVVILHQPRIANIHSQDEYSVVEDYTIIHDLMLSYILDVDMLSQKK